MTDAETLLYLSTWSFFSARTAPAHVLFLYMVNVIWCVRMTHCCTVLWLMPKFCSEIHAVLLDFHCQWEQFGPKCFQGCGLLVTRTASLLFIHADLLNWVELPCCNTVGLIIRAHKLENTSCYVFHLTVFIHHWLLSGFFTLSLRWEENQILRLNKKFCCFLYNFLLSDT